MDSDCVQRKVGTGCVWTIEVILPTFWIRNSKRAGLVELAMPLLSFVVSVRDFHFVAIDKNVGDRLCERIPSASGQCHYHMA